MKATELRIGNCVYNEWGKVDEIVKLTRLGIFTECDSQKVQPIPITEEWLLKFGFEESVKNWFSKKLHQDRDHQINVNVRFEKCLCMEISIQGYAVPLPNKQYILTAC